MKRPVQARSLLMIERVLDATESLVAREGIGSLTMDAVSAEAGVSKGAVQHHFRSKNAIVAALASRKLRDLRSDLDLRKAALPPGSPRALAGMAGQAVAEYGDERSFSRALLVAAVENSNALGFFKTMFADTFKEVEAESDGRDLDPLLLFAVMGLLLSKTLGIADLPPERVQELFKAIFETVSQLS